MRSYRLKPCPFCGEELEHYERWDVARKKVSEPLTREFKHPKNNGCVLLYWNGGMFTVKPDPVLKLMEAWDRRA